MSSVEARRRPLLAIELSQRRGGVALIDGDGIEHAIEVEGGRRDRDLVAPAVASVLDAARLPATELAAIAVDVGPGGFTGLRISVSLGQSLALATGASVIGVPGAVVAAASTATLSGRTGDVLVLAAAKHGTAWATRLHREDPDHDWRSRGRPGLLAADPGGFGESPPGVVLADEHVGPDLRAGFPAETSWVEPRFDALSLARLAVRGGPDVQVHEDPATLVPLYPREPEAVRLWRERSSGKRVDSGPGRPG